METDRELLELAAKATGFVIEHVSDRGVLRKTSDCSSMWWNPLDDDGDALRLAVKLELSIQMICGIVIVTNIQTREEFNEAAFSLDDFCRIVRRAIVRAAAAIGAAQAKENDRG